MSQRRPDMIGGRACGSAGRRAGETSSEFAKAAAPQNRSIMHLEQTSLYTISSEHVWRLPHANASLHLVRNTSRRIEPHSKSKPSTASFRRRSTFCLRPQWLRSCFPSVSDMLYSILSSCAVTDMAMQSSSTSVWGPGYGWS